MNPKIIKHFANVDQIWHAGDIGSLEVIEELEEIAPVKAVYGNVDDFDVRRTFPEILEFKEHNVKVLMTHIGGYPGHYSPNIKQRLYEVSQNVYMWSFSYMQSDERQNVRTITHQSWCSWQTRLPRNFNCGKIFNIK